MRRLILDIQKGGLGDHLFYSHIPRIAKETGMYDEVFISNRSLFRHPDYKKLVWEYNPYINGFTDEPGEYRSTETINKEENLLDKLMLLYGLDDGKRFHEPELYYRPEYKPELAESVIYDPNYISYTGDLNSGQLIKQWFDDNNITVTAQMKKLNHRYIPVEGARVIGADSLFDFCSLLVSCKRMYCLTTGTATIAAALNVPVTVFYGTGHDILYRHSKLHEYIHVGSDYGVKEKIKKQLVLFLSRFMKIGVR
jgi:hypothetical protein